MKTKIIILLFLPIIIILCVFACRKDIYKDVQTTTKRSSVKIMATLEEPEKLKLKSTAQGKTFVSLRAKFVSKTSEASYNISGKQEMVMAELPDGEYDVEVVGYVERNANGKKRNIPYAAKQELKVEGENTVAFKLAPANPFIDFKIEEIFFAGTSEGFPDQYIKITNNSDVVLLADSLVIMEAAFANTTFRGYTPDLYTTHFSIHAIYQIPGDGTENVVESGASLVIADQAADHTQYNPNSRDLSIADFEWYDEGNYDIDYPAPNLTKIFSIVPKWSINNRGYKSLAIGHLPTSVNEYLNKHKYNATYTNAGGQRDFTTAYSFPLEWIADGVNLLPRNSHTPPNSRLWLHHSVDASYTDLKKDILFPYDKSLIRKRDALNKIVDTDNSAQDFYVDLPSIY